ncbi:MAG: Hpt domain-containing protein [Candidatus Contendobacter sp.]|nr:Hpt domain-containing protein [Candidatus Contendobacter sp.]
MISHRVADNRLELIKEDLLLALRRMQLDVDLHREEPRDLGPLEAMIEAIDQIRGPLVVLEHREAVALLEAMRALVQERVENRDRAFDPALMRQATERLADYLEASLSLGAQRSDAELSRMKDILRQAHQGDATPTVSGADATAHPLLDILRRLQYTLAAQVDVAPERPESWKSLRSDLQTLQDLLARRNWARGAWVLARLDRVVGGLSTDAAESYGALASEVCTEILTGLGHALELDPAGDDGPVAVVLRSTEEHLTQMETLLRMAPLDATQPVVAPAPAAPPKISPTAPAAGAVDAGLSQPDPISALALDLAEWRELEAPASMAGAVDAGLGQPDPISALTLELAEWPESETPAPVAPIPAPTDESIAVEPSEPRFASAPAVPVEPDMAASVEQERAASGADTTDLAALIGLADGDPEFVEIFMEEACGELATIREQLDLWRARPDDQQALTSLRRSFHTLKGSGRMVGATVIGDFAWEFENLLNQVLGGAQKPEPAIADVVAAAAAALAPLVGEVPLSGNELTVLPTLVERARALLRPAQPKPTPLPGLVIPAGIDLEFVEVFLEEARGELATIQEHVAGWRRNLADRQAPTILRRAFHTLKGSGRVVGATVIGEFAAGFENLLNHILNGTLAATPMVADLVGEAADALDPLEPLIGDASTVSSDAVAALNQLTARAEALLREQPLAEAAPAPVQPVVVTMPPAVAVSPPPAAGVAPEPLAPPAVELELAQIFQYEAAEILDTSDAILQQLNVEPDQPELLNDLRRGMHTLKGSSRMAGIMTFGDLAHAAESVLDALGKSREPASPVVLDHLQHTLDQLNQMLGEAAGGTSPPPATDLIAELHRLADAVATGGVGEGLPTAPIVPEEAAVVPEPRSLRPMTELDRELVEVFQTEAAEVLDSSDLILRRLRDEPANVELLNNLRREMHTLKGGSRMAGILSVGDLAHAAESVLDALGKGTASMSASVLDALQHALDGLHQMLADVIKGARLAPPRALIDELQNVLGGGAMELPQPTAPVVTAPIAVSAVAPVRPVEAPAAAPQAAPADSIRVSAALLNTLVNQMGESSIFRARIDQGVGAMSFNLNELEQTISRLRRQVTNLATQAEARIQSRHDHGVAAHQQEFDPLELDRFTELQQVTRSLMEIADDLGNVGNTLSEHARDIAVLLDQQSKVNKEIQQGLMRTGMVRFGSIIPRLRRVVRQAAQELGKRAELLVGGEESEVDRTVLENMVAPLEHMLRNSLAHGVETPERRRTAGKSEIGTISLSLRREGAELVLELGDDGGGLNFDAIRAKGEEKGLLLPGQPVTREDLIALLLRPGFSTAATVDQIAGRGVGMDVVNEAIRAMRGALLIQTERGQGTRFIIRLPFSLSVTQALLARAGESLFAIPLLSIELVTRLNEKEFQSYLKGEQVQHQYSGRNYPIHNLGILVGSEQILPFEEVADRRPPALLFRSAEASVALQVEAVQGNQEIIVKPVGPQFSGVPGISGATVLGDGRVVVVLELAALVRNIGSQTQRQVESRALRAARQEVRPEKLSVMVIDDSITMRKVTARILERHNIRVITAKDGLDAVAMLQTQVPDLAILDIEMPRMDGFEVLAHVRNQATLSHLPVIMVTSRGGDKHRDRAMKLGVNDYLTKPYQEEQLLRSIRQILGERAQELIL